MHKKTGDDVECNREQAHREARARGAGVATAKVAGDTQGKALLEDFDSCCRRVSCKLQVEYFQDAILLSDNLLNCPRSVQRWCVTRLAAGEESGNDLQQIGQWASKLLKIWSRRWIHLDQDVHWQPEGGHRKCGSHCLPFRTTCEQRSRS